MKLGLTVIYLIAPENEPLLRLHLRQIAALTVMPYRIYAAAPRLLPQFRPLLDRDDVTVVDLPEVALRAAAEHSHYLRALIETALADGVTHLCTLHVDSFPVREGWDEHLRRQLEEGSSLAAMLRTENTDDLVPCTAGIFFPADFYRTHQPIQFLPGEPSGDPDLERFRRRRGNDDSGVLWGYRLHRGQLPWHRLLRSNAVNDHPVLGGIYDDVIFHLGGHLRRGVFSLVDRKQFTWARLRSRVKAALPHGLAARVPASLRARPTAGEQARRRSNEEAFALITARLLADPEGYLAYLRGHGAPPAV